MGGEITEDSITGGRLASSDHGSGTVMFRIQGNLSKTLVNSITFIKVSLFFFFPSLPRSKANGSEKKHVCMTLA